MTTFGTHLSGYEIEELAFGHIPMNADVWQHLIACPNCMDSLAEEGEYIAVMKAALKSIANERAHE
jgi:hypothetical protein